MSPRKTAKKNLASARAGDFEALRRLEEDLLEWLFLFHPQHSVNAFVARAMTALDRNDAAAKAGLEMTVRRFGEERWDKVLALSARNDADEEGAANALLEELIAIGQLIEAPRLRPKVREMCRAVLAENGTLSHDPDARGFLDWLETPGPVPMAVH